MIRTVDVNPFQIQIYESLNPLGKIAASMIANQLQEVKKC